MYSYHQQQPASLYPPQPTYPSTSYASTSYQQVAPLQHYAPPPPNPQTMPPPQFRAWFLGKLSELVVNQKNLIHNLAYIANDQANRIPEVIAECIQTHIRKAHPQIKLPSWYLLDSIAKNIGHPYIQLFAAFVRTLFLDSYYAVDVQTRAKMEEMLITWRTGGRGGVELFGVDNQREMERGVGWDVGPAAGPSNRSTGPTRSQVLTELDVILTQKTRAVEINPYDDQSKTHVDTLKQLRDIVQGSSVSPQELAAIASQLRTLARSTASTAPPLPPMVPPPQPSFVPQSAYPQAAVPYQVPVPPVQYDGLSVNLTSAGASASVLPAAADISALFNNLVRAGVVSGAGSSSSATAAPAIPTLSSLSSLLGAAAGLIKPQNELSSNPQLESERDYERRIMSIQLPLMTSALQREIPELVPMLYEQLSLQCKQCAQRFPDDGPTSKKRYEDHVDLHFRQNLRNAQASTSTAGVGTMGRGYTRSWFVGRQDWVRDVASDSTTDANDHTGSDEKGKGRAISPSGQVNSAEREARLRASFVVIPPGDETKGVKCPICKERLHTEFMEDEEEWVWRNAISMKGKIYHATCHADAISANVPARLRHDGVTGSGRSRSATPDSKPQVDVKVEPSPLAGSKRKAVDADQDSSSSHSRSPSINRLGDVVKVEDSDSPRPYKKLALAPA